MEDNEIAKEVIGTIIDEDVIELILKPQENTFQMKEFVFTVLRMDFHAVIRTKEGTKTVIIEMQKGKYFEDLQRFRTKLEAILSIFDQSKQSDKSYILSYSDKLPNIEILQKIIRRLHLAGASEELRKNAEIEDEIETSFKSMARQIQEKEELIEEKDKTIKESKKTIEEKDKTIQEKDKLIYSMAKLLKETGMSMMDIHQKTGLSVEEIEKL